MYCGRAATSCSCPHIHNVTKWLRRLTPANCNQPYKAELVRHKTRLLDTLHPSATTLVVALQSSSSCHTPTDHSMKHGVRSTLPLLQAMPRVHAVHACNNTTQQSLLSNHCPQMCMGWRPREAAHQNGNAVFRLTPQPMCTCFNITSRHAAAPHTTHDNGPHMPVIMSVAV